MLLVTPQMRQILKRSKIDDDRLRQILEGFGLRVTNQRLTIAAHLFGEEDRLVDAETLYEEIAFSGGNISPATVYNTLHHFSAAGMIRPVAGKAQKQLYSTQCCNLTLYHYEDGTVAVAPQAALPFDHHPPVPEGYAIAHIDVAIQLVKKPASHKCEKCRLYQTVKSNTNKA
ncbi:Fur family transcriptional regulator [Bartonella sp. LJL80]